MSPCPSLQALVLLASILLAPACHHAARGGGASPTGPGAEAGGSASLCARLNAENAAVLATLPNDNPAEPGTATLKTGLRAAAVCTPTAGGGWGIRLGGVENRGGELWGRWSIVHGTAESTGVAPDTASGGFAPGGPEPTATASNLQWTANRHIVPGPPSLHDFDGDGEPEAIVVVETADVAESGLTATIRRGRVWQGRAATVQLFPPARAFTVEDLRDVDGDGRPDLITRGPYTGFATVKCGSEEIYAVLGPPLLAHSIAGGHFDLTDAAAVAFVNTSCALTPAPVMVAAGNVGPGIDLVRSAGNVACARLHGAQTTALLALIAKSCATPPGATCPACDDRALLEGWAHLPPPLRLPSAR